MIGILGGHLTLIILDKYLFLLQFAGNQVYTLKIIGNSWLNFAFS